MHGTLHAPGSTADRASGNIGLLLLNAGPAPRAGNSDMYAKLCDRLATRGLRCFRFDLPGLGDSTGPTWPDISSYWRAVQNGANDSAVCALIEQLSRKHDLRGMVVGGLCAGAICAIRVSERTAGLVLFEPNFRLAPNPASAVGSDGTPRRPQSAARRKLGRVLDVNAVLQRLTRSGGVGTLFRPVRPMLQRILAARVGHNFPPDTLVDVILKWQRTLESSIPSLAVVAAGLVSDRYLRDIGRTFSAAARRGLVCRRVEGTNHILTAGDGCRVCIQSVEAWIASQYPGELVDERPRTPGEQAAVPASGVPLQIERV